MSFRPRSKSPPRISHPPGDELFGTLTIDNSLPSIAKVAARCREVARVAGFDADALADLQVALDEILSNAIRHAFPDGGAHRIAVRFRLDDHTIEVTVEYGGVPFDPADAPAPDLDLPLAERRTGGLGVHFARELTNALHYERIGELNRVTLAKKPSRPAGAGCDGTA